jgi:hypothetical protein
MAIEIDTKQRKRLKVLSRRIRASLDEVLEIARAAGCEKPALFVECGGPTFWVLDREHPSYLGGALGVSDGAGDRQAAAVLSLPDRMPQWSDVGAW